MQLLMKCTILSVSMLTIVLPKRTAFACGIYVSGSEYRFWLLQPDITNEADLTPFYFSSTHLYKQDLYAGKEIWNEKNVQEWSAMVNGNAAAKDIDGLMNDTNPQDFFDQQQAIADTNSFMRALLQPRHKELLQYMVLSKQVEQIAANPDPWEEGVFPESHIQAVVEKGQELYKRSKSEFVKLRTAFQLIRLHKHNLQTEAMDSVYQAAVVPSRLDSWVKSAALYQCALRTAGYKSDYMFSKVFDKGDYNRALCLEHFTASKVDSVLPFAKNAHERNVLLAMGVFNYPGRSLPSLQSLYRSEPNLKELPFLLLREINKAEDWLMSAKLTNANEPAGVGNDKDWPGIYSRNMSANYNSDKAYTQQLYAFIAALINDKKQPNSTLLHVYAAHLCLLLDNYQLCSLHLAQAEKKKIQLPQGTKTQLMVDRYLLQLENGFDQKAEQTFMKILQIPDDQLGIYDPAIMKNQLVLFTTRKLIKQGLKAKGLMLLSRTNRAMHGGLYAYKNLYEEISDLAAPKDYDEIMEILAKKKKSEFEQFISTRDFVQVPGLYYDKSDSTLSFNQHWNIVRLMDDKSTWYIKNHRLPEALTILQQLPESYWKEWPQHPYIGGNPFYLNVNQAHRWGREDSAWSLNKKQVVEEMVRLEELAQRDPSKAALCYYQLGNAWYNMSWHGKNWMMVKKWWSSSEGYGEMRDPKKAVFNRDHYGCETALNYYRKARLHAGDKKLAALSFFMQEECRNNMKEYQWYLLQPKYTYEWYKRPGKLNKKLARQQGIDLEYYTALVEECELYQSFVRTYTARIIQ